MRLGPFGTGAGPETDSVLRFGAGRERVAQIRRRVHNP
jgi:hypothetical protein